MNVERALREADLAHLWHPFTPARALADVEFPIIERAEGVRLYDVGGRSYLDGISSWWCVNLGHRPPRVMNAIRAPVSYTHLTLPTIYSV